MKLAVVSTARQEPCDFATFSARQSRWLAEAADRGAELTLLPDGLACELRGDGGAEAAGDPHRHAAELQRLRASWLQLYRQLAITHAMAIVAGAFPVADGGGRHALRSDLLLPDGTHHWQDRLHLSAAETGSGLYRPGCSLNVLQVGGTTVGIAAGPDAAYPLPVHAQCQAGATLLLMPVHVHDDRNAVETRIAAQAKALENGCVVAQSLLLDHGCASAASWQGGYADATVIDPGDPGTWLPRPGPRAAARPQWQIIDIDLDAASAQGANAQRARNWASQYFPSVRQPRRLGPLRSMLAA